MRMLASGEGQGPHEDEEKAPAMAMWFAGHDQRPLVGAEPKRDQGGQREFVRAGDGVRDADRLGSPRTWTERESDGARHDPQRHDGDASNRPQPQPAGVGCGVPPL